MADAKKDQRTISAIHMAAAKFINRESNRRSLVTVTEVELFDAGKGARVFVSVMPKEQTPAVVDFLSRQRQEFLSFLKQEVKLHLVPRVTFLPDPAMGISVE